jgi:hypothetical protein
MRQVDPFDGSSRARSTVREKGAAPEGDAERLGTGRSCILGQHFSRILVPSVVARGTARRFVAAASATLGLRFV